MLMPLPETPKSSSACLQQVTEVGPPVLRYGPDMSLSTPILTVGAPCARGRTSGNTVAAVAVPRRARREMVMASIPSNEDRHPRKGGGLDLGPRFRGGDVVLGRSYPQILMQLVHVGFEQ